MDKKMFILKKDEKNTEILYSKNEDSSKTSESMSSESEEKNTENLDSKNEDLSKTSESMSSESEEKNKKTHIKTNILTSN